MTEYSARFPVGNRTCTMFATCPGNAPNSFLASLQTQWTPDIPALLSVTERAQYVNGMGNFLASLNNQLIPLLIRVEL